MALLSDHEHGRLTVFSNILTFFKTNMFVTDAQRFIFNFSLAIFPKEKILYFV